MPSLARTLLVAAQISALAALVIFGATTSAVPVLASPIPPMPSAANSLDSVAPRSLDNSTVTGQDLAARSLDERGMDFPPLLLPALLRRDVTNIAGVAGLYSYYEQMQKHSSNMNTLYRQASASSSPSSYQSQYVYELTEFQNNMGGFTSLLAQLGSDKGLANYDKTDSLETLLKNVVNANKDLLKNVTEMSYAIPGLGSTVGPIVYQIKCILDLTLDAVENLTDAILNAIAPLLQPVISLATTTFCNSGLQIAGLCVLL